MDVIVILEFILVLARPGMKSSKKQSLASCQSRSAGLENAGDGATSQRLVGASQLHYLPDLYCGLLQIYSLGRQDLINVRNSSHLKRTDFVTS